MKAFLTLTFVLFITLTAQAQNSNTNDTVEPIQMDIVLDGGVDDSASVKKLKSLRRKVLRAYTSSKIQE